MAKVTIRFTITRLARLTLGSAVNIYSSDNLRVDLCYEDMDEQTIGLTAYISSISDLPVTDVSFTMNTPEVNRESHAGRV